MATEICIHCYVSGRVQGVWFRAETKKEADKLNLKGWVRNLPDGRVEVLACGNKDAVLSLQNWLKEGPELAKVDDLKVEEVQIQHHEQFIVK